MKGGNRNREWSPEQLANYQAIRERFRHWHPGPQELLDTGVAKLANAQGELLDLAQAIQLLKTAREERRFTLDEVAAMVEMHVDIAQTLESPQALSLPIAEFYRYASALGVKLQLVLVDVREP